MKKEIKQIKLISAYQITCDLCISSALNAAAFGLRRSEKCLAVCG